MQFPGSCKLLLATALALLGLLSPAHARNCFVPRFTFCPGCETPVTIIVQQNKGCTIGTRAAGGVAGQEILSRPSHGVYGSANHTAYAYVPAPGYVGEDEFSTRLYYEMAQGKSTFTILHFRVKVVPTL
jgi:hypothetical protein